jgi:hypothetical protein
MVVFTASFLRVVDVAGYSEKGGRELAFRIDAGPPESWKDWRTGRNVTRNRVR